MANQGFGSGIGLQYRIPSDQFGMVERAFAQDYRAGQAKAKKGAADDKAVQSWMKAIKLDPTKVHQLDWQEANKIGAEAAAKLQTLKESGDPNWQNQVYPELQPLLQQAAELTTRKASLDKAKNDILADQSAGVGTPEQAQMLQILDSGDRDALKKFQDKYGNIKVSQDYRGRPEFSMTRLTKEDIDAEVKKEMATPANQAFLGKVMESQIDPSVKQYLMQYGLPRTRKDAADIASQLGIQPGTSIEDVVTNKQSNLGSRAGYVRQMGDWIEKNHPEFFDAATTDDEKAKILTDAGLSRYTPMATVKTIEKQIRREKPFAPPRASASQTNPIYDVTINYNSDKDGSEQFSPSYKGTPEPKGFIVEDEKTGVRDVVFGVADMVKKIKGKNDLEISIKKSDGEHITTTAFPENLTQLRAQWGASPFDVRNQANKKAGHNDTAVHPSTTGVAYGNLYKERPKTAEAVTTPPKGKAKKNFATMSLVDKQNLQKQSGAKTKEEFASWLDANGYTY